MADWRNGKRKRLGFKMTKIIILGGIKYHVYQNKDKRIRAYYVDKDGKYIVRSFPRILMEEKLGYPLKPDEDVHHIDGDVTNNDLSNLCVIDHKLHERLHFKKYFDRMIACEVCGKEFLWTGKQESNYQRDLHRKRNKVRRARCCSKHCSYLFSKGYHYQVHEQNRRDSIAECELNGESFPNGNAVPINNRKVIECVETVHSLS